VESEFVDAGDVRFVVICLRVLSDDGKPSEKPDDEEVLIVPVD